MRRDNSRVGEDVHEESDGDADMHFKGLWG